MTVRVIARTEWGALSPNHNAVDERGWFDARWNVGGWLVYAEPLDTVLRTIVVHHSALGAAFGVAEIQRLHLEQRGLADIAYHFVVAADGQVYEGRELGVRGAHVRAANTGSVGVMLAGNFEECAPPDVQWQALDALVGWLRGEYPGITHLAGHADFNDETVCPGRHVRPRLAGLAMRHGLEPGTGGYVRPRW